MLAIRLSRIGKKKKPIYRLTVAEKSKDPYGRALEILGSYNPFTKELVVQKDRIEHWLGHVAQMSPTVNNLLIQKEIIKGEKVTASKSGKKKEEEKKEGGNKEIPKQVQDDKVEVKKEDEKAETPKNETKKEEVKDKKEESKLEEAK